MRFGPRAAVLTEVTAGCGLAADFGRDERTAALAGDDQAALAEHLHGVPHRLVGHAVLLGKCALGRQLVADLADLDPCCDVVGHLDIREVRTERVYHGHVINVGTLRAA